MDGRVLKHEIVEKNHLVAVWNWTGDPDFQLLFFSPAPLLRAHHLLLQSRNSCRDIRNLLFHFPAQANIVKLPVHEDRRIGGGLTPRWHSTSPFSFSTGEYQNACDVLALNTNHNGEQ
jgi:hypothetical protein